MFKQDINVRELIRRTRGIEVSLPSATVRALNFTAFDARDEWSAEAGRVFDRPTSFTLRAPLVKQATQQNLQSEVFIRDQAAGGTPPSRYLQPQVHGGPREQKPFERLLQSQPGSMNYYAPGRGAGASLDQFGNVRPAVLRKIISQLQASEVKRGTRVNESAKGRASRLRRQRKKGGGGSFFLLERNRGKLRAGTIYERITSAHGSAIRSVLFGFEQTPQYRPRYDVFTLARKIFDRTFPTKMQRELLRIGR